MPSDDFVAPVTFRPHGWMRGTARWVESGERTSVHGGRSLADPPSAEIEETRMAAPIDELGPVDFLVVEFPQGSSHFTGEMAEALATLVEAGTIRVLDILILAKAADGSVEAMEIDDLDALDDLRAIEAGLATILAEEDVEHLAAAMEPGTVAGVLVWENCWAAPFAAAARRSGGQLVATGRIPIQAIIASLEADAAHVEGT